MVKNVLSKSFGVRVDYAGNAMISNLIYRNETLPLEDVKIYYPLEDGQSSVLIEIFENSALRSENNVRLEIKEGDYVGAFDMDLPEGITKDTPITVKFRAAEDGTISAEVECLEEVKEYNLESFLTISDEELEKSKGLIERVG
jgi:molecular chaperone DnaK